MQTSGTQLNFRAWLIWLVVVGTAAAAVMHARHENASREVLFILGLVFAFGVLATGTLAGKLRDAGTIVVALWGASFGLWAMPWLAGTAMALQESARLGWIASDLPATLHLPVAILSAGWMTVAVLYLATGSARVAGQATAGSLAAAVTPLIPEHTDAFIAWSAVLWHALICQGLCAWALQSAIGRCCRHCGTDMSGQRSPICPRCGEVAQVGMTAPRPTPAPDLSESARVRF